MSNTLHEAALDYAKKGWMIFPCYPNSKKPATAHGFKDASCDINQINAWWQDNPQYNIAICPEDQGLCVVDYDKYKGKPIDFLELPETFTIETPRKGEQYYFVGSLPPTASKLGPAIDTRGQNSYVLVPPSVVNGKSYRVKKDIPYVTLPEIIAQKLWQRTGICDTGSSIREKEQDISQLHRAENHCTLLCGRGDIAIAGRGGDSRTYALAAKILKDYGLDHEDAFKVIWEKWNPHCQPPWSEPELRRIIEHAASYGQNKVAIEAVLPSERFKNIGLPKSRFKILDGKGMLTSPEPKWIIPELLPESSVGAISAPKGSFKTFLALDLGLGIATGLDTFAGPPTEKGSVYYAAHEGFNAIGRVHYNAWCRTKGLDPEIDHGFYLVPGPKAGEGEEFAEFTTAITHHSSRRNTVPKLIVLDTYSRTMVGLDENNPNDATRLVEACYNLEKTFPNVSTLILAHKGKDPTRGIRGSSSFEAALDFVIDLNREAGSNLVKAAVRFQRTAPEKETPYQLLGEKHYGSLVFKPIAGGEVRNIRQVFDNFDLRNVATILRNLGATADHIAVSTEVLAVELTPRDPTLSQINYDIKLNATKKTLAALARTKLKSLILEGTRGQGLKWVVPIIE